MPRYFFHVDDGHLDRDDSGTVLRDVAAARREAVLASAAMLRDQGSKLWNHGHWFMQVHAEADRPVFTLSVTVEDHA